MPQRMRGVERPQSPRDTLCCEELSFRTNSEVFAVSKLCVSQTQTIKLPTF
jgi:hypothetical protein